MHVLYMIRLTELMKHLFSANTIWLASHMATQYGHLGIFETWNASRFSAVERIYGIKTINILYNTHYHTVLLPSVKGQFKLIS